MPFPRKLLSPGEEVVVEEHPNWSVLLKPILLVVAVLAGFVAITVAWGSEPVVVGYILAAIVAVVFLWFLAQIVAWRSRLLVITTGRIVYRWGVLRRTGREIPLERVQDVTYHQTIVERLLQAGSLTIESAGRSGQEPFPDVRHPAELQSLVNRLLSGDRDSWRQSPEESGTESPEGGPPPVTPRQGVPRVAPQEGGAPGQGGSHWWPAPKGEQQQQESKWWPAAQQAGASQEGPTQGEVVPQGGPGDSDSSLAERLRELEHLHQAGVLTDAEFDAERRRLLGLS